MSYQVLARKWRPKSFDTLVGQEHVVRALSNALDQNRLHHAYLFTGTRGVGKTTLSRILAKALNCELGISSHPCGVCNTCKAIEQGSFVDYVEMDAASNRGVDDMTNLLEKAVYAPTQGRYKVYMLDEVHQLTGHAFNAMLKTLEEPPAHIKFILATTDPQKVPVTVLSRCLQFNLKQMSHAAIASHLQFILQQENIAFEPAALPLIGRAAAGSMRDALSLLDQAIAFSSDGLKQHEVRDMLGVIDQHYLYDMLGAIQQQDGQRALQIAHEMQSRSLSFDTALGDLALLLHQIACAQIVPESIADDAPECEALLRFAQTIPPEHIQLYYQICLLGRRDIALAPDEFAGFSMTLMRMLAFKPVTDNNLANAKPASSGNAAPQVPSAKAMLAQAAKPSASATQNIEIASAAHHTQNSASVSLSNTEQPATLSQDNTYSQPPNRITTVDKAESPRVPSMPPIAENAPAVEMATTVATSTDMQAEDDAASQSPRTLFDGDWRALSHRLKSGLAKQLAQNCEVLSYDARHIRLAIAEKNQHLLHANNKNKLNAELNELLGYKPKLEFEIGGANNTPAVQQQQEQSARLAQAEHAINNDEFVKSLIEDFGATLLKSSIKPA